MKYLICAKIVGAYLPTKFLDINDCKISKGYSSDHFPYDTPVVPTRDMSLSNHSISHGVLNFIQYPQKSVSVRAFESEYTISTEIDASSPYRAQEEAILKFEETMAALSFTLKNTLRNIKGKRIKREDEHYDFEIVAGYLKQNETYIRIKLPQPLTNTHNFFPSILPKGFALKAKNILDCKDPTFWKALLYFHKAEKLRNTGAFNELVVTLNFTKSIELISLVITPEKKNSDSKTMFMKERIELTGKKLGVTKKNILNAQNLWDVRSDADIAHAKKSGQINVLNFFANQSAANEFLQNYYKYRLKNPPPYYIGNGRNWRGI